MKSTTTLFCLIASLISTITLYAQDPNIIWQKTIGGSDTDFMIPAISTNDNGLIIGGYSKSNISNEKTEDSRGGFDYWIVKVDESGNIEWDRTLGGDKDDILNSIVQTSDNGYLLGGYSESGISGEKTESSRGGFDYWIIKLNSSGTMEWQKTIGGNNFETVSSVIQTTDEGFLIGGYSESNISGEKTEDSRGGNDCWIIKLNNSGVIEWQKTIGGSSTDYLFSVIQTNDSGYLLGSTSNSHMSGEKTEDSLGGNDFWVLKLDNNGNILWQNTIGGDESDFLKDIIQTSDGKYMLAGWSYSNISGDKTENSKGEEDYWIIKLEETGDIIWQNTMGGDDSEQLNSIIQLSDGGYLLAGWSISDASGDKTEDSNGNEDYWVVKVDGNSNIISQNTLGGNLKEIGAITFTNSNDNYYIAGYSNSNISGDKTEASRGEEDYWIVKHSATLGLDENSLFSTIEIYPNPAKNTLQLNADNQQIDRVKIFSAKGDLVQQVEGFETSKTIDVSQLASGLYYIQFTAGRQIATKKFVKQ